MLMFRAGLYVFVFMYVRERRRRKKNLVILFSSIILKTVNIVMARENLFVGIYYILYGHILQTYTTNL